MNDKPLHDKNCSNSRFSVTFLRVGSAEGVNGPVIFLEKVTKVHPSLRVNNLVTKYGFARMILCDSKQSSIHGRRDLGKGGESGSPCY